MSHFMPEVKARYLRIEALSLPVKEVEQKKLSGYEVQTIQSTMGTSACGRELTLRLSDLSDFRSGEGNRSF